VNLLPDPRQEHSHSGLFTDPLDFDEKCDQSIPLEEMIKPDPAVRQLFLDIDRSKCRVWALTNAFKPVRRLPPSAYSALADRALISLNSTPSVSSEFCSSTI
jgi:hypothetical protein